MLDNANWIPLIRKFEDTKFFCSFISSLILVSICLFQFPMSSSPTCLRIRFVIYYNCVSLALLRMVAFPECKTFLFHYCSGLIFSHLSILFFLSLLFLQYCYFSFIRVNIHLKCTSFPFLVLFLKIPYQYFLYLLFFFLPLSLSLALQ